MKGMARKIVKPSILTKRMWSGWYVSLQHRWLDFVIQEVNEKLPFGLLSWKEVSCFVGSGYSLSIFRTNNKLLTALAIYFIISFCQFTAVHMQNCKQIYHGSMCTLSIFFNSFNIVDTWM